MMDLCLISCLALADDLLVADFEGKDYGGWTVTGTAFGPGPARGTLPDQMPVSGFKGKGFVNTYFEGDGTTGTLTSPPFTLERRFINFMIGGGRHPGETCINLLVEGKVVRMSTGRDSERLEWDGWDVAEFSGKTAAIEIVDRHKGGWGHINVDHIVQSEKSLKVGPLTREVTVTARYLHLPVRTGAPKRHMKLLAGDAVVREFEIELDRDPSFWAFADLSAWKGQALRMEVWGPPESRDALEIVTQGGELKGADALYEEIRRPQFHFTSRRGWLNDPNGLVSHKGEYHLFYQHNPYGWNWGNMHWGHAVSRDLVRWQELPLAIYPTKFGDWAFSGSAVVDAANTAGFKTGGEDVLVAAYTSTGRGECIVYSNDRGRTWKEFSENPVVKHAGRDPKLLWHAPTKQWVMAVYDEKGKEQRIAFYTSPDLKTWTFQSLIDGFFECPDLFNLSVDGDAAKSKWVLYAADGKYVLGAFDGKMFISDGGKQTVWHGNFYAAQTFSDVADGRRIQIGWAQGVVFPGMPFNQQMTVPVELTLRRTAFGVKMVATPVKELDSLHGKKQSWKDVALRPGENPLAGAGGELLDLRLAVRLDGAEQIVLTARSIPIVYDAKNRELSCSGKVAPLPPIEGAIRLRILVDRGSVEIFGNDGLVAMSAAAIPSVDDRSLALSVRGGAAHATSLEVIELNSSWK